MFSALLCVKDKSSFAMCINVNSHFLRFVTVCDDAMIDDDPSRKRCQLLCR